MVAINAKEICRFEVRALKRFLCKALLRRDFVRIPRLRFLLTLEDKISGKGHFIDDSSEHKFIFSSVVVSGRLNTLL